MPYTIEGIRRRAGIIRNVGEEISRYGPRLSPEEYDRRVTRIHDRAVKEAEASVSPADIDQRVRALELDLAIDRWIGVDFPPEQRREVIRARTRVEERRSRLTVRLLQNEISTEEFAAGMQGIVDQLVDELSSIVPPEELKSLLRIPALDAAALPLDRARIDPKRQDR